MIHDWTRLLLRLGRKARPATAEAASGALIGYTSEGVGVRWPAPTRELAAHGLVLGASGAGKTVLTVTALLGELATLQQRPGDERPVLCVVDPKGDLVAGLLEGLAYNAPELLSSVNYLDPFGPGFPFNLRHLALGETPLDIRATQLAALVAEVSTSTGSQRHLGVGARQVDALVHLILAALDTEHPDGSVLWALDALTTAEGFAGLAKLTRSARARQFLKSARLSDELRASTASRLRAAFAATSSLERLVTTPSCLQLADLLAPGAITLIDLGRPTAGLTSLQTFYANLLVRLIVEHLMERPSPYRGAHVRLVIDEAQVVAAVLSDVAERVLTTGRSRAVSLTALSQGTVLLREAGASLLQVLLTNSPLKLVGRLAAPDAALLAREQAPRPGVDEPAGRIRERFASAVTNLPEREFFCLRPSQRQRFTSLTVDLPAWERAAEEGRAVIEAVKERHAVPPADGRLTLVQAVKSRRPRPGPGPSPGRPPVRSPWD